MKHRIVDSPIGKLLLVGSDSTLTALYTPGHRRPDADTLGERDDTALAETARQLGEYFAGERTAFNVTIAPDGTAFQQRVWAELRRIPHGETASYGEIAGRLGNPNASRAVGAANGRNPISIIVPCHRVIGASGTLTGYAGGLDAKAWLLDHEKATATARSR